VAFLPTVVLGPGAEAIADGSQPTFNLIAADIMRGNVLIPFGAPARSGWLVYC
jgi:hypothetical protein